jgi:hypothetical protein
MAFLTTYRTQFCFRSWLECFKHFMQREMMIRVTSFLEDQKRLLFCDAILKFVELFHPYLRTVPYLQSQAPFLCSLSLSVCVHLFLLHIYLERISPHQSVNIVSKYSQATSAPHICNRLDHSRLVIEASLFILSFHRNPSYRSNQCCIDTYLVCQNSLSILGMELQTRDSRCSQGQYSDNSLPKAPRLSSNLVFGYTPVFLPPKPLLLSLSMQGSAHLEDTWSRGTAIYRTQRLGDNMMTTSEPYLLYMSMSSQTFQSIGECSASSRRTTADTRSRDHENLSIRKNIG